MAVTWTWSWTWSCTWVSSYCTYHHSLLMMIDDDDHDKYQHQTCCCWPAEKFQEQTGKKDHFNDYLQHTSLYPFSSFYLSLLSILSRHTYLDSWYSSMCWYKHGQYDRRYQEHWIGSQIPFNRNPMKGWWDLTLCSTNTMSLTNLIMMCQSIHSLESVP